MPVKRVFCYQNITRFSYEGCRTDSRLTASEQPQLSNEPTVCATLGNIFAALFMCELQSITQTKITCFLDIEERLDSTCENKKLATLIQGRNLHS